MPDPVIDTYMVGMSLWSIARDMESGAGETVIPTYGGDPMVKVNRAKNKAASASTALGGAMTAGSLHRASLFNRSRAAKDWRCCGSCFPSS